MSASFSPFPNQGAADAYARTVVESGNELAIAKAAEFLGTTPAALIVVYGPQASVGDVAHAPVMVRLSDVRPRVVHWLWTGRIALGKLTLIAGDPGLGKSFLTLDMAARVSNGAGWPDEPNKRFEPGGVVLLSAEDDLEDTIRPRLDAAGADVSRINALQTVRHTDPKTGATMLLPFTLAYVAVLEAAIKGTPDCRLVVVDPISAYMGGSDSHVNAEVRAALAPLAELAQRYALAVVAVTHLRKGEGAAIYRAMGSLAFVAAARAAWAVTRDSDDPTKRRRLFLPVKNNLGNDQSGLAFELRDNGGGVPAIAWSADPVTVSADDAMAPPATGKPGPDADQRQAVEDWLRAMLADGPRLTKEVIEEGQHAKCFSKRTIERARQAMGVVAFQPEVPGPWWLKLPDRQPVSTTPHLSEPGDLGGLAENKGFPKGGDPHTAKLIDGGPNNLGAGCSDPVEGEL